MRITLDVPDAIAESRKDLPGALLESFALEGYRSGKLTEEQVRKLLGYGTRLQVDGFLKGARSVFGLRPGRRRP